MVGRKKKHKVSDKVLEEDRISQLPDPLKSEILAHIAAKDAVSTSALSKTWRNIWQCVPELDLDSHTFPDVNGFVSFAAWFFDPQQKSWIRKLRLCMNKSTDDMSFLTQWIDAVISRKIQHLHLDFNIYSGPVMISCLSMYTSNTLVHLRIHGVALIHAEFVSLPCLKIMHLECVHYHNGSTLHNLVSGSPVLEDLAIIRLLSDNVDVLQVCSQTLKKIDIDHKFRVVIDAPLLQFFRTKIYLSKDFEIINLGSSTKLDIDVGINGYVTYSTTMNHGILTDISRIKDLVIGSKLWKKIFIYSDLGPVLQFCHLSHLNARICISNLETLPTLLKSCPKLESLILELVKDVSMRGKKKPKVMFSTVPQCLASSLKLVEFKRLITGYEGEIELVRYFLKNSTILEKLKVDVYYTNKAMCAFLKEVVAMPRCSSACEVLVL